MSPHQSENPDPYRDRRPPERQPRQGANPPPTAQGSGPQGPPPEQFSGRGSPQPGQASSGAAPAGSQGPPTQGSPTGQPSQPRSGQARAGQQQPVQQGGVAQQPAPQGGPVQQQLPTGGRGMQGPQLRSAPIDEVLQSEVVTVRRDAPIAEAVEQMASEDVGCVVVVEEERPVGILTDRSVALALTGTTDLSEATAGDLVAEELVTGTTEMTVFDVLERLEAGAIRRLPIVDDDETLQGIVTLDDVVVLLSKELSDVASVLQRQSPRF